MKMKNTYYFRNFSSKILVTNGQSQSDLEVEGTIEIKHNNSDIKPHLNVIEADDDYARMVSVM